MGNISESEKSAYSTIFQRDDSSFQSKGDLNHHRDSSTCIGYLWRSPIGVLLLLSEWETIVPTLIRVGGYWLILANTQEWKWYVTSRLRHQSCKILLLCPFSCLRVLADNMLLNVQPQGRGVSCCLWFCGMLLWNTASFMSTFNDYLSQKMIDDRQRDR